MTAIVIIAGTALFLVGAIAGQMSKPAIPKAVSFTTDPASTAPKKDDAAAAFAFMAVVVIISGAIGFAIGCAMPTSPPECFILQDALWVRSLPFDIQVTVRTSPTTPISELMDDAARIGCKVVP